MRFSYPEPETVATYLRDQVPGIAEAQVDEVVEFSRKYDLNFDHLRAISFELRRGETFAEVIGDLNIKRPERPDSVVEARITWQDGEADVLTGRVDLFDREGTQSIDDLNADISLRFRLRDAVTTSEGYSLPAGTFELVDMRSEDEKPKDGELPAVASVVITRARKRPIDFRF